jgi:sulfate adenylyltransferase subunit 2
MKTEALKQALDAGAYDFALGGARRDEERSRAKERVFSVRGPGHVWDPKRQRPELWRQYNGRLGPGETMRVFPLSDWTELDVWTYIQAERMDVVSLYFAAPRPTVERDGVLLVADDDRFRLRPGERLVERAVRFRSLGCYPLCAAVESDATTIEDIIAEMRETRTSERAGRLVDNDQQASMERKKRDGYF